MVPNTTWILFVAAASTIAGVGSNVAGIRHGPGYVSGKHTKCAPSPAARSIACTASATLAWSAPGRWQIGCTTAMRNGMAVLRLVRSWLELANRESEQGSYAIFTPFATLLTIR